MSKKNKKAKQFKTEEVKVFKQFRKQRIFQQVSFVVAALVVAFGLNTFVLNGEYGNSLKTNILESSAPVEKKADIFLETVTGSESNIITLRAGKQMDNVKTLSLGIIYNPEEVEILDMFSNINGLELSRLENEKGIATLLLNFNEPSNITQGKDILNFYATKKQANTQHLNVINSNFTDGTNTNYQLTTSGVAF